MPYTEEIVCINCTRLVPAEPVVVPGSSHKYFRYSPHHFLDKTIPPGDPPYAAFCLGSNLLVWTVSKTHLPTGITHRVLQYVTIPCLGCGRQTRIVCLGGSFLSDLHNLPDEYGKPCPDAGLLVIPRSFAKEKISMAMHLYAELPLPTDGNSPIGLTPSDLIKRWIKQHGCETVVETFGKVLEDVSLYDPNIKYTTSITCPGKDSVDPPAKLLFCMARILQLHRQLKDGKG